MTPPLIMHNSLLLSESERVSESWLLKSEFGRLSSRQEGTNFDLAVVVLIRSQVTTTIA
jgi:hypothetical protein